MDCSEFEAVLVCKVNSWSNQSCFTEKLCLETKTNKQKIKFRLLHWEKVMISHIFMALQFLKIPLHTLFNPCNDYLKKAIIILHTEELKPKDLGWTHGMHNLFRNLLRSSLAGVSTLLSQPLSPCIIALMSLTKKRCQ